VGKDSQETTGSEIQAGHRAREVCQIARYTNPGDRSQAERAEKARRRKHNGY